MKLKIDYCFIIPLLLWIQLVCGEIWLTADYHSNTYALINSTFGGNSLEVPDCGHQSFGPHITQQVDNELNRSVFIFHIHINSDNDRCSRDDRQRVEIKPPVGCPENLKGYDQEIVSLSWNFKLYANFRVSPNFCSVHQVKVKGGNDSLPLITINLRKRGRNQLLEVIHNAEINRTVLKSENLSKFLGQCIHAKEELKYGKIGKYSLVLSRWDTEEQLLSVTKSEIDLWRDGAEYARPKWGIYRSLATLDGLRDEDVYFDSFCLGKGTDNKCA